VRGALGEKLNITNRYILEGGEKPVWQAVAADSSSEKVEA
jgi:hypothetical protein